MSVFLSILLCGLLIASYLTGLGKAKLLVQAGRTRLSSRPVYHGTYSLLWAGLPVVCVLFLWMCFEPMVLRSIVLDRHSELLSSGSSATVAYTEIRNAASGAIRPDALSETIRAAAKQFNALSKTSNRLLWILLFAVALIGFGVSWARIRADLRARDFVERVFRGFLFLSSTVAVLTTVGIICSLIFESWRFFQLVPFTEFLFGTKWSPQMAIRADQVGSSGAFGSLPLFAGTALIASIAMFVAVPIGLLSAIYLSEYASKRVRGIAKPVMEVLAGIPTVVYGFFAAITVAPHVRLIGEWAGLQVSSESALAAGSIMGIMIIPFVSSLSDDVINAVPQSLRDASLALGATKSETIKKVVFPAALPGIVGAVLLAISRAIGETMIVVMAAGLAANLTANPLSNVTTVTVQIVTILVGDQEFNSPKTLAAFALGLVLFCITLVLNVFALKIVKRYREKYE